VNRLKGGPDFINKLKTVEEEADETLYWLKIMQKTGFVTDERIQPIYKEVNEIIAMTVASLKTMRNKL